MVVVVVCQEVRVTVATYVHKNNLISRLLQTKLDKNT